MHKVLALIGKFRDTEWLMVREMLKEHDEWVALQKPIIVNTSKP